MTKTKILLLGILTFLAMLILSVIFYKERTCFLDISYHLFSILKDGSFAIQNNRFGAFFTQLFPLIGSKFGISLKSIAIAYSISFVILPFLTFLTIHLSLKNSKISVVYLLFVALMTTHTFYWIQSELPQAMAFLFIFIALLDNIVSANKSASPNFWLFSSILLFIVCFTHPLVLFALSFVILYYYISFPTQRAIIKSAGLIYFSFYIIKSLFFKTTYDSQAIGGIKNFVTLFPNYFTLQSNKNLLKYFIHDYYFIILSIATTTYFYLKEQQYQKCLLVVSFFLGYCLLINVSYPNGADQFYLENQYLILSFIVALPFAYDILPKIKNYYIPYGIISFVCLVFLFRIINTHHTYTNRLKWNQDLLSKTENLSNKKLIISSSKAPTDTLLMKWGSSYEFWLLSTIETGNSRSIIIEEGKNEFDWTLPSNSAFVAKWGKFEYKELNRKYFIFNDTSSYVKIQ